VVQGSPVNKPNSTHFNIQFKHWHFLMFSIQSLAANSGSPLVRIKFRHP
jgi:hypothetical protein